MHARYGNISFKQGYHVTWSKITVRMEQFPEIPVTVSYNF